MMNREFKETSVTLLQRIAVERTGADEAAWVRFWELYQPAMLMFAKSIGAGENAEDVVQDVLVKLVAILRRGAYERQDGKLFRSYLKTLIRRQMIDLFRKETARGYGRNVPLSESIVEDTAAADEEVGRGLDASWARACQAAAVDHVLTRTALARQSKEIYRAYVLEDRPIADVAKAFGVSRNLVSQIKLRVDRMVASQLAEYGDDAAS